MSMALKDGEARTPVNAEDVDRATAELLAAGAKDVTLVGSAYVVGYEQANDADLIVLVEDRAAFVFALTVAGWSLESGVYADDTWQSLRKGQINALVTASAGFHDRTLTAAEVTKALNLTERADRVKVYGVIVDGKTAEDF